MHFLDFSLRPTDSGMSHRVSCVVSAWKDDLNWSDHWNHEYETAVTFLDVECV